MDLILRRQKQSNKETLSIKMSKQEYQNNVNRQILVFI